MVRDGPRSCYVIDSHALHWYLLDPTRLGPGAQAALRLAEVGEAELLVPAIVLAELVRVWEKAGRAFPVDTVMQTITASRSIHLIDLGLAQLMELEHVAPSLDMHDRLILADAILARATLITRDRKLQAAGRVPTIW